jgi:two-component system, chemotaxis family, chemotaxis protein CheY
MFATRGGIVYDVGREKPFDRSRGGVAGMMSAVPTSAWRAVPPTGRGPGRGAPLDLATLRYLIVDDSRFYRSVIKNALAAVRLTHVAEAVDGSDALQALRTSQFDFVLVDYEMPVLNGIEFVRKIRWAEEADALNARIPIIMVSQFAHQAVVVEARNAGVHEFLTKPVSPQLLYERIRATILQPREFIVAENYRGPDRRWMKRD